jgi:hypothetical protein
MFEQTESQKTVAANDLKHLCESELLDVLECARKASSRDHALLLVAYTHGLRNQEVARPRMGEPELEEPGTYDQSTEEQHEYGAADR